MSDGSYIEWLKRPGTKPASWNPVVGCSVCSVGCQRCYAMTLAHRFSGAGRPFDGLTRIRSGKPVWTGEIALKPKRLSMPMQWRKPRTVFVTSMGELFHGNVPFDFIAAVYGVMAACPRHTFVVLTKRARRRRNFYAWLADQKGGPVSHAALCALAEEREHHPKEDGGPLHVKHCPEPDGPWPLPNVIEGISASTQADFDHLVPDLLACPAAVRCLSLEPMLESLNVREALLSSERTADCVCGHGHGFARCPNYGAVSTSCHATDCDCAGFARKPGEGIGWVIVGAESGHGARPMDEDWVRSLRDQCVAAGVPLFYKQRLEGRRKVSLPMLDGKQWSQFPGVHDG